MILGLLFLLIFIFTYFAACSLKTFFSGDLAIGDNGLEVDQVCVAGNCDKSISLPQGYSLDAYNVEKVSENPCVKNSDCETPMEYLIQSRCPFVSICLKHKCAVICPAHQ
jgi:hypothetical protein